MNETKNQLQMIDRSTPRESKWFSFPAFFREFSRIAFGSFRAAVPGFLLAVLLLGAPVRGQTQDPVDDAKKTNARPAEVAAIPHEPFDGVPADKMAGQCVTLDTEAGIIIIEMIPEVAPESVRNFLNLAATGALDTTTFSRIVKDFVIQGGNLFTNEKWGIELSRRMARKLPDEPSDVKHVRGIVSMARSEEPNSATTHFFILVGDGHHLDGKFAAFGRVTRGLEVADAINHSPAEGGKPEKPVHIKRAGVAPCAR
jgi:peptidyl-prolyl cis-trans isomerase B (cyclophilin B)